MAIRITTPKRAEKARQSKTQKDVLQRLYNYINSNSQIPIKFLVSFWKDQQNVFTYKEIREAILSGNLTERQIELWRQDYTKMVEDQLYPLWLAAIQNGPSGQPIFDAIPNGFVVETGVPNVIDWITTRGAEFVTAVVDEQKKAIQALLVKNVTEKFSIDELSRIIRPCVGLTVQQTKASVNYYENMKKTLAQAHPRMRKKTIEKRAREAQIKYAARLHRERAKTIAHTEMAFAFAKGADEGVRQAQEQGLLGTVEKEWVTSGIESRVCDTCRALNGVRVPMGEEFGFKGRALYPGQKQTPPAHPRCMCAIMYIEIAPPIFKKKEGEKKMKKFSDLVSTKKNPNSEKLTPESGNVKKKRFKISKSNDEKKIAFGWANVSIRTDGEVVEDWQEDIIEPEELENAAYNFVELYRDGGEMHERGGAAVLIESVVFTKEKAAAMGIPEGTVPTGWWIGFKVLDDDVWEKVKDGTYSMFSIEGEAVREEVEDDD